MALNLAYFVCWTLRDKPAQGRLALRLANSSIGHENMLFKNKVSILILAILFSIPSIGLPQDESKSQEELANLISPPSFFSNIWKIALAGELGGVLQEELRQNSVFLGKKPENPAAYPLDSEDWYPSDLKYLARKIRQITKDEMSKIDAVFLKNDKKISLLIGQRSSPNLASELRNKFAGIALLSRPDVAAWAEENILFESKTELIYAVATIYSQIIPSFAKSLVTKAEAGDELIFTRNRPVIRALLASKELVELLGEEFDFKSLINEEIKLRQDAIRLFGDIAPKGLYHTYSNYIFGNVHGAVGDLILPETRSIAESSRAKMQDLGNTAWYVSKAFRNYECKYIEDNLDVQSLKNNANNWTKITDKNGKYAGESLDGKLFVGMAFINGCGVKQNLSAGVRVYEALAMALETENQVEVRHVNVYCDLSRFYRNGVGVSPDTKKAQYFSKMYAKRYDNKESCATPWIDPRNRWNTLN